MKLLLPGAAEHLQRNLEHCVSARNSRGHDIPPQPVLPKRFSSRNFFLNLDPLEIARQLTLVDYDIYRQVHLRDLFNRHSPAVSAMIARFNHVTQWATSIVLNCRGVKERAAALRHLILLAQKCLYLRNFHALKAIIGSLTSAAVHRLQGSRALVPKKVLHLLEELERLTSAQDNYKDLRRLTEESRAPFIPWLGLYLKDMAFIKDAQPTFLDVDLSDLSHSAISEPLINLAKCRLLWPIMRTISNSQRPPKYPFIPVPMIRDFLTLDWGLIRSPELQYQRSLFLEPKACHPRDLQ